MQHSRVNFGGIRRFEFVFIWVFIFLLRKSGLIFKSPVATLLPTWQRAPAGLRRVQCMSCNAIIYPSKSAIMSRIQTPHLVQLMNTVSNYIFDCNNRDANRAFVTFRENTAPVTTSFFCLGLLNAKFTFKGRPRPIIFARIVRPMNALQLCR